MSESFKPKFKVVENKRNEKFEGKLDMVIIIPAFKEGMDILKTLHSDVKQIKEKHNNFIHGIVVVVNRKKNSANTEFEETSNFETLKLLYYLSFGFKFTKKGNTPEDKLFNQRVEEIQNSGVPIFIVDATSKEYLNEEMNVGMARKIGTEFVADKITREGDDVIFYSQDADTIFGQHTLAEVKKIVDSSFADAGPLVWGHDYEGLTDAEKRSARLESLVWAVRNIVSNLVKKVFQLDLPLILSERYFEKFIETKAVWMQGGGSFFNRRFLKQSGGYDHRSGYGEDTNQVFGVTEYQTDGSEEKKAKVASIAGYFPKAIMYTKPRHSDRPDNGYGHTMLKRNFEKGKLDDFEVESFESIKKYYQVVQFVSFFFFDRAGNLYNLNTHENRENKENLFLYLKRLNFTDANSKELYYLLKYAEGKTNSYGHHNFLTRLREICEENNPKQSFSDLLGNLSMSLDQYAEMLLTDIDRFVDQVNIEEKFAFSNFAQSFTEILSFNQELKEIISEDNDFVSEVLLFVLSRYAEYLDEYFFELSILKFLEKRFEGDFKGLDIATMQEVSETLVNINNESFFENGTKIRILNMQRDFLLFLKKYLVSNEKWNANFQKAFSDELEKNLGVYIKIYEENKGEVDRVTKRKVALAEKHKKLLSDMGFNVEHYINELNSSG